MINPDVMPYYYSLVSKNGKDITVMEIILFGNRGPPKDKNKAILRAANIAAEDLGAGQTFVITEIENDRVTHLKAFTTSQTRGGKMSAKEMGP